MKMTKLMMIAVVALLAAGVFMTSAAAQSAAMNTLSAQLDGVGAVPSGQTFTLTLDEATLSQAAAEALKMYETEVKAVIKQSGAPDLSLSDPKVDFLTWKDGEANVKLSVKVGKGFLKVTVKADAQLSLVNGAVSFNVMKLDVPVMSIDVNTVNSQIAAYLGMYNPLLSQIVTLTRIETMEDSVVIEGIKN